MEIKIIKAPIVSRVSVDNIFPRIGKYLIGEKLPIKRIIIDKGEAIEATRENINYMKGCEVDCEEIAKVLRKGNQVEIANWMNSAGKNQPNHSIVIKKEFCQVIED